MKLTVNWQWLHVNSNTIHCQIELLQICQREFGIRLLFLDEITVLPRRI
jgi:hypothetical protein